MNRRALLLAALAPAAAAAEETAAAAAKEAHAAAAKETDAAAAEEAHAAAAEEAHAAAAEETHAAAAEETHAAAAENADAPATEEADARQLAGQPLLALVRHPSVGPRLRAMAQGHQRALAEAVRGSGPPLAVTEGRWVHGRARAGERRVLLAFDARTEQVALILFDGPQPLAFIPPRGAPWPAALQGAVEAFSPQVRAALRFQ